MTRKRELCRGAGFRLHSPNYRNRFEPDLKKSLARIPLCATGVDFAAFAKTGRKLADLHCGYETAKPWPDCVVDVEATQGDLSCAATTTSPYQLTKMRFAKKDYPVDEIHLGKRLA